MDPEKAARNRATNIKIMKYLGIPVGIFLALVTALVIADQPPSEEKRLNSGSEVSAQMFCENFLPKRGTSPGEAKFDWLGYSNIPVRNGWIIMGEIDTDTRHEFRCEVSHDGATDGWGDDVEWTLVGLSVDGDSLFG